MNEAPPLNSLLGRQTREADEVDMNPTIWAALIGLIGTILAALIPWLLTRKASARNETYDKVTGSITDPQPDQTSVSSR